MAPRKEMRKEMDHNHVHHKEKGKSHSDVQGEQITRGRTENRPHKVDNRVRVVVENAVGAGHRCLFVIVGPRAREQVPTIHYVLTKTSLRQRPSVLWCYKNDLGFSSNPRKRQKQLEKMRRRKQLDVGGTDPFELFLTSTNVRYVFYRDTERILGQTFGMCVLQDFEALTPNTLARTVETVEGGGVIVMLVNSVTTLKQLYTMAMDAHARFRTDAHADVVPRFNERFILSLATCSTALVVDDELTVLPISSSMRTLAPAAPVVDSSGRIERPDRARAVASIVSEKHEGAPYASLLKLCASADQVRAVAALCDAIAERRASALSVRATVALTAARGRGKSAALGLAVAFALKHGLGNIIVTAPAPENVATLFEFLFRGLEAVGLVRHRDWELVDAAGVTGKAQHAPLLGGGGGEGAGGVGRAKGTGGVSGSSLLRVTVMAAAGTQHRQVVQYVVPRAVPALLATTELVVVDEAAAIPRAQVRAVLGPHLVLLSSTVNGYEGTGRSLSLKLIAELRQKGSILRELQLEEPMRYLPGDPVERWLYNVLCLDAVAERSASDVKVPLPRECKLYHVNRDALFSFHPASEAFLRRLVALFVESHYKNSPNDLLLLSDAPAHEIFVLLGPVGQSQTALPDVLVAVQVSLEGAVSGESALASQRRGTTPHGDLIPWTVSQNFQDPGFARLAGARVVRIATHPDYMRMGYGSRALDLLLQYFDGKLGTVRALVEKDGRPAHEAGGAAEEAARKDEKEFPPMLDDLSERPAEALHWLGTSYGLTQPLFDFWGRAGFLPVYLRQTPSDVTGEYSCIMLREVVLGAQQHALQNVPVPEQGWIRKFNDDFKRRMMRLLSFEFRTISSPLALSCVRPMLQRGGEVGLITPESPMTAGELEQLLTPHDLRRLESYAKSLVDYHVVLDLMPVLAMAFFEERLAVSLSIVQQAILVGVGLRHVPIDELQKELNLPASQLLAIFNKAVRKISVLFRSLAESEVANELSKAERFVGPRVPSAANMVESDDEDEKKALAKQLSRYAIRGGDAEWEEALASSKGGTPAHVSIASKLKKRPRDSALDGEPEAKGKKRRKHRKHKHQR